MKHQEKPGSHDLESAGDPWWEPEAGQSCKVTALSSEIHLDKNSLIIKEIFKFFFFLLMTHFMSSAACCICFNIQNVALTFIYSQKINEGEKKPKTCQEDVSFKTNLLRGLILDSTSCKRFSTSSVIKFCL